MWNPFRRPKPATEPDTRSALERRGWAVSGTTTNNGFIVTVRKGPRSATFRAPTQGEALIDAALYVEAHP